MQEENLHVGRKWETFFLRDFSTGMTTSAMHGAVFQLCPDYTQSQYVPGLTVGWLRQWE